MLKEPFYEQASDRRYRTYRQRVGHPHTTSLSLHVMQLVDGKTWLVSVPGEGQVHVIEAEPRIAPLN